MRLPHLNGLPGETVLGSRVPDPDHGPLGLRGLRGIAARLGGRDSGPGGLAGLKGLGARVRGLMAGFGGLRGGAGLERLAWFGAGLSAGSAAWLAVGELAVGPLRAPPTPPPRPTLVPLRVQVDGAVGQPGVYDMPPGARVEDALRAAGGLSPTADASGLNLVARVADGQRIAVPLRAPPDGGRGEDGRRPSPVRAPASPRPTRTATAAPRAPPSAAPAAPIAPIASGPNRPGAPPSAAPAASGPNRAILSPW